MKKVAEEAVINILERISEKNQLRMKKIKNGWALDGNIFKVDVILGEKLTIAVREGELLSVLSSFKDLEIVTDIVIVPSGQRIPLFYSSRASTFLGKNRVIKIRKYLESDAKGRHLNLSYICSGEYLGWKIEKGQILVMKIELSQGEEERETLVILRIYGKLLPYVDGMSVFLPDIGLSLLFHLGIEGNLLKAGFHYSNENPYGYFLLSFDAEEEKK